MKSARVRYVSNQKDRKHNTTKSYIVLILKGRISCIWFVYITMEYDLLIINIGCVNVFDISHPLSLLSTI